MQIIKVRKSRENGKTDMIFEQNKNKYNFKSFRKTSWQK